MNQKLIDSLLSIIEAEEDELGNLAVGSREYEILQKDINTKHEQVIKLLNAGDTVYMKEQELAVEREKIEAERARIESEKAIADTVAETEAVRSKGDRIKTWLMVGTTLLTSIFGFALTRSAYEANTESYIKDPDAIKESKEVSRKGNLLGKM